MKQPFLIMSILVRDEADIIEQNLRWHRRQGVDRFVVIDHASTDGTTQVLRRLAREMPIDISRRTDPVVQQAIWTRDLIRKARGKYGHVWHIANDADEFYIPPPGETLKSYLLGQKDNRLLEVPRQNVIFAREDLADHGWRAAPMFESRVTTPAPEGMESPETVVSLPFEYYATNPKVVFQVATLKHLTKGAHRATMDPPCEAMQSALRILHFPFRDAEEFLTSARRLGESAVADIAQNPQKQLSHRYRRWLRMMQQGVPDTVILNEAMPDRARLQHDLAKGLLTPLTPPADLAAALRSGRALSRAFGFQRLLRRLRRKLMPGLRRDSAGKRIL
ncbi:glycosyltransferase family 2 protein [Neogemmobacter tilapiae]|uniref:Glycosyltransferase family 2 protein n=1 Tax=Neogemmobacter tilapiae TaxID=875041 RepID=A0A918TK55_9RHOB|nr:glycosyltransferase family 2 protein [Gemmobacter tilapiae]GHC52813.1 hypothetical protein GCM10007315_14230 [Gemmobacter tilapiae]